MMKKKSVLEVPVFGRYEQDFEKFIGTDETIREKKYHDFILKEYAVDDNHLIYFYFMDYIPDASNLSLVDQIVPKAPFTIFLIDPKEGFQDEETKELLKNYYKNFSTPVFLVIKKDPLQFYTKIENDPIVVKNNFQIILVEEESQIVKEVMIDAIKKVIPVNI